MKNQSMPYRLPMIVSTLGLLAVAALHAQSTEYVYSGPRLIAIERIGPAGGEIRGYKIDAAGVPFNSPGATITVDSSNFGPSVNPYAAYNLTAGAHTVSSNTPSGYTVSYSICTNCVDHPAGSYVTGTAASVTVPSGGYVDLYWKYTSTNPPPPPSGSSAGPKNVATVATSGGFDVFAYGVQNATSVSSATWSAVNGQDDIVWYAGADQGGGTWKGTVDLTRHRTGSPDYGLLSIDTWLYGPGGSSYLDSPSFSRYLTAISAGNPGFETGSASPWALYGSAQGSAAGAAAHSGSYGFTLTSGDGGVYQDTTGLLPGNRYTVRAWVRASGAGGPNAHLWAHDTTGANVASTGAVATGTAWQQLSITFTATSTGMLRIHLHREPGGAGSVYWDDLTVATVALANPGFESGSSPWTLYSGAQGAPVSGIRMTGNSSFALTSGAGGMFQNLSGLTPGQGYTIQGWARGASTGSAELWVHDTTGANQSSSGPITVGTTWQFFTVSFTATANGMLRVHAHRNNTNSATIYWDDLVVRNQ